MMAALFRKLVVFLVSCSCVMKVGLSLLGGVQCAGVSRSDRYSTPFISSSWTSYNSDDEREDPKISLDAIKDGQHRSLSSLVLEGQADDFLSSGCKKTFWTRTFTFSSNENDISDHEDDNGDRECEQHGGDERSFATRAANIDPSTGSSEEFGGRLQESDARHKKKKMVIQKIVGSLIMASMLAAAVLTRSQNYIGDPTFLAQKNKIESTLSFSTSEKPSSSAYDSDNDHLQTDGAGHSPQENNVGISDGIIGAWQAPKSWASYTRVVNARDCELIIVATRALLKFVHERFTEEVDEAFPLVFLPRDMHEEVDIKSERKPDLIDAYIATLPKITLRKIFAHFKGQFSNIKAFFCDFGTSWVETGDIPKIYDVMQKKVAGVSVWKKLVPSLAELRKNHIFMCQGNERAAMDKQDITAYARYALEQLADDEAKDPSAFSSKRKLTQVQKQNLQLVSHFAGCAFQIAMTTYQTYQAMIWENFASKYGLARDVGDHGKGPKKFALKPAKNASNPLVCDKHFSVIVNGEDEHVEQDALDAGKEICGSADADHSKNKQTMSSSSRPSKIQETDDLKHDVLPISSSQESGNQIDYKKSDTEHRACVTENAMQAERIVEENERTKRRGQFLHKSEKVPFVPDGRDCYHTYCPIINCAIPLPAGAQQHHAPLEICYYHCCP